MVFQVDLAPLEKVSAVVVATSRRPLPFLGAREPDPAVGMLHRGLGLVDERDETGYAGVPTWQPGGRRGVGRTAAEGTEIGEILTDPIDDAVL